MFTWSFVMETAYPKPITGTFVGTVEDMKNRIRKESILNEGTYTIIIGNGIDVLLKAMFEFSPQTSMFTRKRLIDF